MTDSPLNPPSIVDTGLILLDVDAGRDKEAVIGRLAALLADAGRAEGTEPLLQAALAREAQSATGLPGGSPSRTAGRPRCAGRRSRSHVYAPRWTSALRTVRRTWCS